MRKSDFVLWLEKFKSVDLPIGDLAIDVLSDKSFPQTSNKDVILNHLKRRNACTEAIQSFEAVWDFYIKTK